MKKTQKKKSVHSTANRHTVIVLEAGRGRIGNGTDSTAARREIVCNFRLLFCRFFSCYILQTNILFAFIFAFIPHFFLYICSMRAANVCISLNNFIYSHSRNRNSWSFYVSVGRCCCSAGGTRNNFWHLQKNATQNFIRYFRIRAGASRRHSEYNKIEKIKHK